MSHCLWWLLTYYPNKGAYSMKSRASLILFEDGKQIKGGLIGSNFDGEIEISSFNHAFYKSFDESTGKCGEGHRHFQLSLTKPVDQASPVLYNCFIKSTILTAIFKFYYLLDEKEEKHYYEIMLENAVICNICNSFWKSTSPSINDCDSSHNDSIILSYDTISYKHIESNIVFSDKWKTQRWE
jgi:type VI secretion system secreted protein Hcp